MKCSMRVAVGLGVGYLLGRRRKLRTATVMAVAAAAGGTRVGRVALRRGAKQFVDSGVLDKVPPQVGEIVDAVRGDLLDAAKTAASAEVASRIDSLSDSLHDRAERLRNPGATVAEGAGAAAGAARDAAAGGAGAARGASGTTRRLLRRGTDSESRDDEREEERPEAPEREAEGGRRRRAGHAPTARGRVPRQRSSDDQPQRRARDVKRESR